ncbi:MAG: hypothetical protein AAF376_11315 [Pseudomonadota bacterium]
MIRLSLAICTLLLAAACQPGADYSSNGSPPAGNTTAYGSPSGYGAVSYE